jgi:hypothetical protein
MRHTNTCLHEDRSKISAMYIKFFILYFFTKITVTNVNNVNEKLNIKLQMLKIVKIVSLREN